MITSFVPVFRYTWDSFFTIRYDSTIRRILILCMVRPSSLTIFMCSMAAEYSSKCSHPSSKRAPSSMYWHFDATTHSSTPHLVSLADSDAL